MNIANELFLLNLVKIIFFFVYLVIVAILVIYNWLYLTHTLRANRTIGLYPPERIRHLVSASTFIALTNAFLVIVFLLFGYY